MGLNFSNSNSNKEKSEETESKGIRGDVKEKRPHTRKPVTEIAHVDVK